MPTNPFSDHSSATGPTEPPPAYSKAPQQDGHLAAPQGGNAGQDSDYSSDDDDGPIPHEARGDIADELRELPPGWTREFDANSEHYFYVDTTKTPPRSIWVHPFDDPEYIASIPDSERQQYAPPSEAPPSADSKGDVKHRDHLPSQMGGASASISAHASGSGQHQQQQQPEEKRTLGRKMKDKLTGSSHDERVADRKHQQEEEMKLYQQHLIRRKKILEAQRNGTYRSAYAAPSSPYTRVTYGGGYPGYGGYSRYGGGGYYGGNMGYGMGGGYGGMRGGYGGGYSRYGGGGLGMGGAGAGLLGGMMLGGLMF